MPTLIKKSIALLFLGFVALFFLRLVLGFFVEFPKPAPRSRPAYTPFTVSSISYRKDCANNMRQIGLKALAIPVSMINAIEVYTREARLQTVTNEYDADLQRTMATIQTHDALVRFENTQGVNPNRSLSIVIRVPLDNFDPCVLAMKEIGEVETYSVTKEDKTEETKRLIAEKNSLITYRDALEKLRESDGEVSERVELESKIQEIQEKIEKLDVNLGEFVKQESYNNIHFTLVERIDFYVDDIKSPISSRVMDAFVWTCLWYLRFACLVVLLFLVWLSWTTLRRA